MIKAKAELSPKNMKPAYDLLYGKKYRRGMIIDIIFIVIFTGFLIRNGDLFLMFVLYAFRGVVIHQSFTVILILVVMLAIVIGSTVRVIIRSKALLKLHHADDNVTGMHEYEFGEDGIFSRVTKEGFLCERFSVYSTVDSVTEYKDNFIVRTRGQIGVFAFSDICEGDADMLRELLRQKLEGRFVTKK